MKERERDLCFVGEKKINFDKMHRGTAIKGNVLHSVQLKRMCRYIMDRGQVASTKTSQNHNRAKKSFYAVVSRAKAKGSNRKSTAAARALFLAAAAN